MRPLFAQLRFMDQFFGISALITRGGEWQLRAKNKQRAA
jgi:hypothetical protein